MKKNIITILFTSIIFTSFSQEEHWIKNNYIGIHAGWIQSSIHLVYNDEALTAAETNSSFTSISAGLSYKNFSEQIGALKVGLATDLTYFQKGGYMKFNLNTDSVKTDDALFKYVPSYLEFTPLMNLRLGRKKLHLNLFAGPHFSYLINEKMTLFSIITENVYQEKADNKFEFGLDFGGGLDFEFGRSTIELRLMSNFGFTDVFTPENINVNLWYDQNRVMLGQLYYFYKL